MRIVLTMGLPYEPALGGANKANRILAEMLARRRNSVMVVVPPGGAAPDAGRDHLASSSGRDASGVRRFQLDGVDVHEVSGYAIRTYLREQVKQFQPDCILVSSEDPMQLLMSEAINYDPARTMYLAHTVNCLPFGPASFSPSKRGWNVLANAAIRIANSQFCADYMRQWGSLDSVKVPFPVYGDGPFDYCGQFGQGYNLLVNPCLYKGIDIFIELAESFPDCEFAAVASWGTTLRDQARMAAVPNIRIFKSMPNLTAIFRKTGVLLVPSLWLESFALIIVEAMLRGIPVLASEIGGIPEAKLGSKYLIPVRPIQQFTRTWDENGLWIPVVPAQDISPWREALSILLTNRGEYIRESLDQRSAAERFVASLSFEPLLALIRAIAEGSPEQTTVQDSKPSQDPLQ